MPPLLMARHNPKPIVPPHATKSSGLCQDPPTDLSIFSQAAATKGHTMCWRGSNPCSVRRSWKVKKERPRAESFSPVSPGGSQGRCERLLQQLEGWSSEVGEMGIYVAGPPDECFLKVLASTQWSCPSPTEPCKQRPPRRHHEPCPETGGQGGCRSPLSNSETGT